MTADVLKDDQRLKTKRLFQSDNTKTTHQANKDYSYDDNEELVSKENSCFFEPSQPQRNIYQGCDNEEDETVKKRNKKTYPVL